MDIFEAILTRRSIRKFTDAPVSDEHIARLLEAAMAAPTACNSQPWRFILVRDQAGREAIAARHPHAGMAARAPLAIVVCADTSAEKFPGFWPQDCAAAMQNLLLAARGLELGTVWTGVYPVEERVTAFQELFNLPPHVIPQGIVVVGHPAQPFAAQKRDSTGKVFEERWNNTL